MVRYFFAESLKKAPLWGGRFSGMLVAAGIFAIEKKEMTGWCWEKSFGNIEKNGISHRKKWQNGWAWRHPRWINGKGRSLALISPYLHLLPDCWRFPQIPFCLIEKIWRPRKSRNWWKRRRKCWKKQVMERLLGGQENKWNSIPIVKN